MTPRRQAWPAGILCSGRTLSAIYGAGVDGLPKETGGILFGWETDAGFEIDQALVVPDAGSTTVGYERDHDLAQEALDAALAREPAGSPLGYIGEWHTHPAPCPPSGTDVRAMRSIARQMSTRPCVLLVAAFSGHDVTYHGAIATRWRWVAAAVAPFPGSAG